jgi:hypothetical protein
MAICWGACAIRLMGRAVARHVNGSNRSSVLPMSEMPARFLPVEPFDREKRARAFAELRRRQAYEEAHSLTPSERLERAEELRAKFSPPLGSGTVRSTDEPPELLSRLGRRVGG